MQWVRRGASLIILAAAGCSLPPVTTGPAPETSAVRATAPRAEIRFSHRERMLIRDYFRRHPPPADPAARPTTAESLYRYGRLPAALRGEPLPADIERRLAPAGEGLVRVRVGTTVLLVRRDSREILDLIQDIAD